LKEIESQGFSLHRLAWLLFLELLSLEATMWDTFYRQLGLANPGPRIGFFLCREFNGESTREGKADRENRLETPWRHRSRAVM